MYCNKPKVVYGLFTLKYRVAFKLELHKGGEGVKNIQGAPLEWK